MHNPKPAGHYDVNYGNFQADLYAQIRSEAFGEDIGQNSWLTAGEQDGFLRWLNLAPGKALLDVACGAGGPALRIAALTGCSVLGVDVHEQALASAASLAARSGLGDRAEFQPADATAPLPFQDSRFDAITCIDAVNHFPDRILVLAEWTRILKPGGRLLFTDPITLTGPMTSAEIAVRSSAGTYLFVPRGYNESVLAKCGLVLLACTDVTANTATVAAGRFAARATRSSELRTVEGDAAYDGQQQFLAVAARVAREGRLSRFLYVAEKSA
jgi:SAM-dependent methyltransferase